MSRVEKALGPGSAFQHIIINRQDSFQKLGWLSDQAVCTVHSCWGQRSWLEKPDLARVRSAYPSSKKIRSLTQLAQTHPHCLCAGSAWLTFLNRNPRSGYSLLELYIFKLAEDCVFLKSECEITLLPLFTPSLPYFPPSFLSLFSLCPALSTLSQDHTT